jgi:hypothetical protein
MRNHRIRSSLDSLQHVPRRSPQHQDSELRFELVPLPRAELGIRVEQQHVEQRLCAGRSRERVAEGRRELEQKVSGVLEFGALEQISSMLALVLFEPPFGSRIRGLAAALFGLRASEHAELVGGANAMAAVVLGVLLWWQWRLSLGSAVVCVAASFVLLTVLLLFRATCWIPMVVGGLALSICPAALLGAGGYAYASRAGAWIGGTLGLAAGLCLAFFSYRRLVDEMRQRRERR